MDTSPSPSGRATQLEKIKRLKAVSKWILDGHSTGEIIYNITQQWGITERMAYKYVADAREQFKEDTRLDIEDKRATYLRRRQENYRVIKKLLDEALKKAEMTEKDKADIVTKYQRILNDLDQDMARLDGLYVEKVEHQGSIQYVLPPRIDSRTSVESDDIE